MAGVMELPLTEIQIFKLLAKSYGFGAFIKLSDNDTFEQVVKNNTF